MSSDILNATHRKVRCGDENDTDEISDYGRDWRYRRLHGSAATEMNHAVRVRAHRPDERSERLQELGAEVVFGALLDFDSVRAALSGVQRAYFCYPISPGLVQATAQFAQAAKEA